MHKQFFNKEQTEPLLAVNNELPSTASLSLSIEGKEKRDGPIKREIRRTWNHLRISMILFFVATLAALGVLIYGCVLIAQASSHSRAMLDTLVADISTFQANGYPQTLNSSFSFVTPNMSYQMVPSSDPYEHTVEKNAGGTTYNSSVFLLENIHTTANNTGVLWFTINFFTELNSGEDVNGTILVSVPFSKLEVTTCSLHQGQQACLQEGGYYNSSTLECSKLFLLSGLCIALMPDQVNGWELSTQYSGCIYPFQSPGIYVQHNYTNITSMLQNIVLDDVMIRSSDDPYISLQALTSGSLSINGVSENLRNNGLYCIAIACIMVGVSFSLGAVLFFVKRKVKRGYKLAGRIPAHYSRPPVFRYLALSLACFGISIGIGFPLVGHWSEEATWTYTPFVGLMLIVWIGPVGMISLLIFWQMVLKSQQWNKTLRGGVAGVVGAAIALLCALCVRLLIKPWRFDYGPEWYQPDYLQIFFGILILLSFFPFATLMLSTSINIFFKNEGAVLQNSDTKALLTNNGVTGRTSPTKKFAIFGLFVLVVVFVATIYLPPIWNVPMVNIFYVPASNQSPPYNLFVSPYSLIHLGSSSSVAVAKLYLDVVVFYGFVAGVVCVALLAAISTRNGGRNRLAKLLEHWVRVSIPSPLGKITIDTSVGEIAFLLSVLALAGWWFWWWYIGYGRISMIADSLERLARVMGHMCNLCASLLLFPVTRNSMWVELLGIPFERAIKYHRWAGVAVFFALTGHMLVWWINWGMNGTLIHNIFSVQNIPHADNWSIPMMHLTWLGAAVMVLVSQYWFRRRKFELFYYTHHFFIVFFVTGLLHSWSLWYFAGGGMILWFIDRLIRFYKSGKAYSVIAIHAHNNGDITQITLQPNGFAFRAGQYAFINIPSITPLEYHPFTISSAPGDNAITFHIKNMGKDTWTARLARVYGRDSPIGSLPTVNIDGPYGNPPTITPDHDTLVLVAGGIGITPIISIFKDQYQLYKQNHPDAMHLKHVFLLWVVRDTTSLEMFREIFDDIASDPLCQNKFHIILRVTQRSFSKKHSVDTSLPLNPQPVMGRPNLQQEFADIAHLCGKHVLSMVCGPSVMVKEVQNAAFAHNFELHAETFEL